MLNLKKTLATILSSALLLTATFTGGFTVFAADSISKSDLMYTVKNNTYDITDMSADSIKLISNANGGSANISQTSDSITYSSSKDGIIDIDLNAGALKGAEINGYSYEITTNYNEAYYIPYFFKDGNGKYGYAQFWDNVLRNFGQARILIDENDALTFERNDYQNGGERFGDSDTTPNRGLHTHKVTVAYSPNGNGIINSVVTKQTYNGDTLEQTVTCTAAEDIFRLYFGKTGEAVNALEKNITFAIGTTEITLKNLKINVTKEVDYTDGILSFVNNNPIVIGIKKGNTSGYTTEDAVKAQMAFKALSEDISELIIKNGYYDEKVIAGMCGDYITAADLSNTSKTATYDITDMSADSIKLISNANGGSANISQTSDSITYSSSKDGIIDIDLNAGALKGAEINGYSYEITTNYNEAYYIPYFFKDGNGKYGYAQFWDNVLRNFGQARILIDENDALTFERNDYQNGGERFGDSDTTPNRGLHTHKVTVAYSPNGNGIINSVVTKQTYNGDTLEQTVTCTAAEDIFRLYFGKTGEAVNALEKNITFAIGTTEITLKNLKINVTKEVDYTDGILSFVNNNPIVIGIKKGNTSGYTAENAESAINEFNAITDSALRDKIIANGYFDEKALKNIAVLNSLASPNVIGATMKAYENIEHQNLRFSYEFDNSVAVPEGYEIVNYGAVFITNASLNNSTDLITVDYVGKNNSKTAVYEQNVQTVSEVPSEFNVEINGTAFGINAVAGNRAGSRIVSRAYATYVNTATNEKIVVYSTNNNIGSDGKTVVVENGQINRSLVGCAKNILKVVSSYENHANDIIGEHTVSYYAKFEGTTTQSEKTAIINYLNSNVETVKAAISAFK